MTLQGGKGRAGEDVPSIYIQCVDEEGPSEAHRKGEGTEEENNRVLSEELRARLRSSGVGGDFPGGPVVKTLCFQCRGAGSIPGRGTKIPHAVGHGQNKIK